MKRILAIAFAVVAVTIMTDASANAQINSSGYGFGVGLNQAAGAQFGGFRGGFLGPFNSVRRFEQPPYFARFPPVYYNRIVRRPYGISPFAAPAGVTPVELTVPAIDPVTVKNKFFDSKVAPVSESSNVKETIGKTDDKTTATWVANPFVETLAAK
jgi:hypothetical protein